jgi:glycine cleavage system H lipoate-binding protein
MTATPVRFLDKPLGLAAHGVKCRPPVRRIDGGHGGRSLTYKGPDVTTDLPTDRLHTDDHEWGLLKFGTDLPSEPIRVGITALAVENLGDLVYVDLPDIDTEIMVGRACGEVESTRTVSEVFSPVGGRVVAINGAVVAAAPSAFSAAARLARVS